MAGSAVLRVLARFKDAWCADTTHHLPRRRPHVHQTRASVRSIGSDSPMVRQIPEAIKFECQVVSLILQAGCARIKGRYSLPRETGKVRVVLRKSLLV